MAVHQGKPKFVDDAVQLALEYETFQNGRKQRIYQKHFGVRIQQMSQNIWNQGPLHAPHATSCGGYNVFDPSVSRSVSQSVSPVFLVSATPLDR